MNPNISRLVLSCLLACLAFSAHAEIYKWTDAGGKTHYSQIPPEDTSTKSENIGDEIGMAAGSAQTSDEADKKVKPEDDDIAKAKEEGEANTVKHQAYCDQQQSALKKLLANPVIRWKSKDDEKVLSSKERTKKISEVEATIKEMCNSDVLASKKKVSAE